jgi:SMC interacting uncharacterized protein involved in chromosome segregation
MKIFKAILVTSLVLLLTSKATFAKLPLPVDIGVSKPTLIDSISKVFTNKCDTLKTKIDGRLTKFENNEEAHSEVFTKLIDRLSERVAKWKDMGYDVDKLEADLKTLKNKVDKFILDYKAFIGKLEAIKTIACGTATEFGNALKAAREALKIVRQDAADIRNYYLTVIRPDIIELKQQTPAVEEN